MQKHLLKGNYGLRFWKNKDKSISQDSMLKVLDVVLNIDNNIYITALNIYSDSDEVNWKAFYTKYNITN